MDTVNLKSCWCGGNKAALAKKSTPQGEQKELFKIKCCDCGLETRLCWTIQEAIKAWNIREESKEIADLKAENDRLKNGYWIKELHKMVSKLKASNDSRARLLDALKDAFDVGENTPELNMGNYDCDEVEKLNNGMIDVYDIIKKAIEQEEKRG